MTDIAAIAKGHSIKWDCAFPHCTRCGCYFDQADFRECLTGLWAVLHDAFVDLRSSQHLQENER